MEEAETKRELKKTTKVLHMDIQNAKMQGLVNNLSDRMRNIEKCNAMQKGQQLNPKNGRNMLGTSVLGNFSKLSGKKNTNSIILELKNRRGRNG